MRLRIALTAVVAAAATAAAAAPALAAGPIVVTTRGAVEGLNTPSGLEWRGIPYAAPPVGNLRWRSPAPAAPWLGVRNATEFGSHCVQPDGVARDGSVTSTEGSEDCLFLNVFAPPGTTAASHLPVMVHLHGGGNAFGWGEEDASQFVAHGVMVVSLNYRLGPFGFVGHPALTAEQGVQSGEYGLLDQLAALHWVHDNIAAFGGDPGNVTLFGFSAGSFDTVALTVSPLAVGLLRRSAVQGDVYLGVYGIDRIGIADELGADLAAQSSCAAASDLLGCLRSLDADDVVRLAKLFDIVPFTGGRVLPQSPLELVNGGAAKPLLVGFDREEDSVFALPFLADPFESANWVHTTNLLVGPPNGNKARALYPASDYDSLRTAYITMETDAVRGCPTRQLANATAAQAPTYRYLFTHVLANDPDGPLLRSTHGMEDVLLWGREWYTRTASEEALAFRMDRYWTNFAKTGDPNGPGLPLWTSYNATTERSLVLDDGVSVITAYHRPQCALLDTVTPFSFDPAFAHGRKNGLFDFLP